MYIKIINFHWYEFDAFFTCTVDIGIFKNKYMCTYNYTGAVYGFTTTLLNQELLQWN